MTYHGLSNHSDGLSEHDHRQYKWYECSMPPGQPQKFLVDMDKRLVIFQQRIKNRRGRRSYCESIPLILPWPTTESDREVGVG